MSIKKIGQAKLIIIVALIAVIAVAAVYLVILIKPIYEQRVFEIIKYKDRQYHLGSNNMTLQELEAKNFGQAVSTGVFYHGREIYDSSPANWQYPPTVIFLKEKDSDIFDTYSLSGGP